MNSAERFVALLLLVLIGFSPASAQVDSSIASFDISISPTYDLSAYATDADRLQALMAINPSAGQALSGLAIYSFHQAYPGSHYQYLRSFYTLTCANQPSAENAVLSLQASDPEHFPSVKRSPLIVPIGTTYTPNDYHGTPSADCSLQLNYINAPTAWGITKGNRNITIGINDPSGFDVHNPDLKGQIIHVDSSNTPNFHGTVVAGCAAAHTDNGIGVAAIGFNCSLYLDHRGGDAQSLMMSAIGLRVINNSWFYGFACTEALQPGSFINDELVYDEVYENGTSTCFAAGNGLSGDGHCPALFSYAYPASLDHIITVGAVAHANPLGYYINFNPSVLPSGGIPWLWKDCHEESPGNATNQYGTLNYQANDRVDISAPAYSIVSTFYDPNDSSSHYTSGGCGTSFASPMVAGTLGLMLSANPKLSPYQLEHLLKTSARNIDYVEYPPGSGINMNANYVGKMGAGALDAGAAVTAASTFDPNDTNTKTLYIEGIELNTICAPGYSSNGVKPTFVPVIRNGIPPYTYRWDPIPGNNTTLDDYASASPTVAGGTFALYRLGVYDHSPIPKEASRLIEVNLTTSQIPMLTMRDSYMDMLNEANTQAEADAYDWQILLSPDIVNRIADDHILSNQNPVYSQTSPNYVNARVRNVGCTASTGTESLYLYWAKAGAVQAWPQDWTNATFTNSTGVATAAGGLITNTPILIPSIAPGDISIFSAPWYPINPAKYDASITGVDIDLLGRIETNSTSPYGMTVPEVSNTTTNVVNNNKIATRSLVVSNPTKDNVQWHQVSFANTENYDQTFSVEIASEKMLHPSFAGDISAYLRVEVELGDIYDRWVAGGSQGNNIVVDGKGKSVIFTGDGKVILRGITLHANEKVNSKVGVILIGQPATDQYFHIRQWLDTTAAIPYGDVSFEVQACDDYPGCNTISSTGSITLASRVNVFPNPVMSTLSLLYTGYDENTISYSIYDIWGQRLATQSGMNVTYGSQNSIPFSYFTNGVYFIRVTDKDNNRTTIKVIKD